MSKVTLFSWVPYSGLLVTQADRSQEPLDLGQLPYSAQDLPDLPDVLGQREGGAGVGSEGTPELSNVLRDLRMILGGRESF